MLLEAIRWLLSPSIGAGVALLLYHPAKTETVRSNSKDVVSMNPPNTTATLTRIMFESVEGAAGGDK